MKYFTNAGTISASPIMRPWSVSRPGGGRGGPGGVVVLRGHWAMVK
ncbi:hypothetical protein ACQ4WX_22715 [Streptomyces lasalocidi]